MSTYLALSQHVVPAAVAIVSYCTERLEVLHESSSSLRSRPSRKPRLSRQPPLVGDNVVSHDEPDIGTPPTSLIPRQCLRNFQGVRAPEQLKVVARCAGLSCTRTAASAVSGRRLKVPSEAASNDQRGLSAAAGHARESTANLATASPTAGPPPQSFLIRFMDDEELHRQHFRRTFDVAAYAASAGLLRNDGVPRIDACDSRIGEYLKNHQPCTIQGVDETWSTRTLWTAQALSDMDTIDGGARARMNVQLAQTHTTLAGGVERHKVTLGWFLSEYCAVQCDDVPLYVFDPQPAPLLLKDCCGAAPPFFPDDWHADLADSLLRPSFRWFSIGPCRSGLPWHCDPAMTSAWNYVASGRKLWMLYPPGCTPPALTHEPDGASSVTSYQKPGGALRWILEVLPWEDAVAYRIGELLSRLQPMPNGATIDVRDECAERWILTAV
ncbi:hypothetical protein PPROV_000154500 [Pycnococcus provasolii]|uniref:JmjC domain-containing protein n=1 Tax=Pycnococcus provasolii TaxID=41880 RepID=A0A830HA33_9CHLO|nr:hypothetical protein PPROV_000154500 [Pycnococcus provasolii]